jgi:hypothetical protein
MARKERNKQKAARDEQRKIHEREQREWKIRRDAYFRGEGDPAFQHEWASYQRDDPDPEHSIDYSGDPLADDPGDATFDPTVPDAATTADTTSAGETLPPITQPLSLEEQRTYDDWLRRNVGDEHRALESIGIDPRRPRYVATEGDRDWGREGGTELFGSQEMGEGEGFIPIPGHLPDQMIAQYAPSWEQALQEKFQEEGLPYDPTALGDIIRNVSYAQNAGKDPQEFLDAAFARIETRSRSGGDRSRGGYATGWPDEDPARYATAPTDTTRSVASGDPPSGYLKRLGELQSSLAALPTSDTSGRAAIQAQIQNMYEGGYQPPVMADIVSDPAQAPLPKVPPPGGAIQTPAAPLQPYSARAPRQPYMASPSQAPPPTAPSFMGTMGSVVSPPAAGIPTAPNWDTVNNDYWRASQDYLAGPNGRGFIPNPWSGTRRQLARPPASDPAAVPDESLVADDNADLWKGYAVGRQDRDARDATYNANQMDRFLRSWNAWNQRGVDPFNTTRRTGGF